MPAKRNTARDSHNPGAKRECILISCERFYDCDGEGREVGEETKVLWVSVPVVVRHYRERPGPQGLEVGRMSPGSLDLALNVLGHLYPPGSDGRQPERCRVNFTSATAFNLHESFCRQFLEPMDPEGGEISVAKIKSWVQRQTRSTER